MRHVCIPKESQRWEGQILAREIELRGMVSSFHSELEELALFSLFLSSVHASTARFRRPKHSRDFFN